MCNLFGSDDPPISLQGGTMVCIQAHNDDFDISLSGIARKYDRVFIVTVMDSGTGHYDLARAQGLIPDDMVLNQRWISPDGNEWTQDYHSESLSEYRIGIMEDRYAHFQYTSIRPDTTVPDAITYNASLDIQREYLRQVGEEIATKLQDQNITEYDLFIHDPELPDHLDHELTGNIGSRVCSLLPPRNIYYFYVYTIEKLPNYQKINVQEHLDHKDEIFSMVWEREDLPMRMWGKDPPDFDEFFRDEILMTGNKMDEGDIEWNWWLPFLIWLREVRIWLGI